MIHIKQLISFWLRIRNLIYSNLSCQHLTCWHECLSLKAALGKNGSSWVSPKSIFYDILPLAHKSYILKKKVSSRMLLPFFPSIHLKLNCIWNFANVPMRKSKFYMENFSLDIWWHNPLETAFSLFSSNGTKDLDLIL